MAAGTKAFVEPSVLEWLRRSAGYSVDDIAAHLKKGPDEIVAVEEGEAHFTIGQVRKLAERYKRSLSDFFLPAPPKEPPMPHDFRRLPGEIAGSYSPLLIRELRKAQERRDVILELLSDLDDEHSKFTATARMNDGAEAVGAQIRDILNVKSSEQRKWGDGSPAYKAWRARISAAGVLIFQFDTVPQDEVLGFSLTDRPLPVIGVSNKQTENRRTFTILHELVHILIGKSAVCDIDDIQPRDPREMEVEVFCNAAAAAALMPREEILSHPLVRGQNGDRDNWDDAYIAAIAKDFGASRIALVRRLSTLGKVSSDFYAQKQAQYDAEYRAIKARQREKNANKEMRRSWAARAIYNLDRTYISSVLRGYHAQRLTLVDAAQFLDVRPEKVREVETRLMQALL